MFLNVITSSFLVILPTVFREVVAKFFQFRIDLSHELSDFKTEQYKYMYNKYCGWSLRVYDHNKFSLDRSTLVLRAGWTTESTKPLKVYITLSLFRVA